MRTSKNSPGVYVSESDQSDIINTSAGSNILIIGFAKQGPVYDLTSISSISEFEKVFGKPSNAAERYLYHSVKNVLRPNVTASVIRIPYTVPNPGEDDKYSCLAYPIFPIPEE